MPALTDGSQFTFRPSPVTACDPLAVALSVPVGSAMSEEALNSLHLSYIQLVRRHLGSRRGIAKALPYLVQMPEIIDIHVGELNAAINLVNR